ncbi:hypothetical protein DSL72_002204 [Monilinia vaccinii-corymbosi]|uniref:Uncharacterized protein n=1 Tax=Monilinia vaccinii-corymbosi TaxID=61207 RepID=A0A8A3PBY2_9HELO|nr:hypothetical protein DSL72_002204 [Monilinia vaccinii-corymbosi]
MSKSPNSDTSNKDSHVPSNSDSDSDNPFIRFRHFADEQVSSILQGFVGLPSAFAKPSNHPHWSLFDEDLKRRDELEARQRGLKDAEEASSGKRITSEHDEVAIPVKKSQRSHRPGVDFDQFISDRRMNIFGSDDIPLYSPLHAPMATGFPGDLRHIMASFAAITLYQAEPSDVSLVPFLFASPYSPLNLSLPQSMMRELGVTKTYRNSRVVPRDDFPYCEAFEDLLLTSQGRDAEVRTSRLKSTAMEASERIGSSVENSLDWVERLRRLGILHLPSSDLDGTSNASRSSIQEDITSRQGVASSVPRPKELRKDAETEDQMYENFLTGASTTPDQFFTKIESTLTAVEKLIKGKNMPFEESPQVNPSTVTEANISEKSNSESTESKREVSSSSTFEQYTNEDGSVETTVRVWKRFSDGSETETSSSHTVEKPTRQRDLARPDFDFEGSLARRGAQSGTDDQKNESRNKKNTKPGWFWN